MWGTVERVDSSHAQPYRPVTSDLPLNHPEVLLDCKSVAMLAKFLSCRANLVSHLLPQSIAHRLQRVSTHGQWEAEMDGATAFQPRNINRMCRLNYPAGGNVSA